jgi:hypothetical protein
VPVSFLKEIEPNCGETLCRLFTFVEPALKDVPAHVSEVNKNLSSIIAKSKQRHLELANEYEKVRRRGVSENDQERVSRSHSSSKDREQISGEIVDERRSPASDTSEKSPSGDRKRPTLDSMAIVVNGANGIRANKPDQVQHHQQLSNSFRLASTRNSKKKNRCLVFALAYKLNDYSFLLFL